MKSKVKVLILTSLAAASTSVVAQSTTSPRLEIAAVQQSPKAGTASNHKDGAHEGPLADGLQPPGIMIGHSGRWMVGYDFMFESMDGNLDGTRKVSQGTILNKYFAAPTDMTMQMHMGMLGYAVNSDLSLMVSVPYLIKSMNHITQGGERFKEKSSGIGDVELRAHYRLYTQPDRRHQVLLNGGVNLPSGSINQRQGGLRLEYPMQLGAGTVSLVPGITYLGRADQWGWGAEFIPTIRVGTNDNGYRLGNQYHLNTWVIRQVADSLDLSFHANGMRVENIHGADAVLDPLDEQTKDPNLQAGTRLDMLGGLSYQPAFLEGQKITFEAGAPVYQSLDGPQLKTTFVSRLNWQLHF